VFVALNLDLLYQFHLHTAWIPRLGPLEWVLNTPSHHRVHHARNPKYLDKNYAGTLIIWDRMFGTFQAEEEEPVYGLTKPLNSWNPLWANLHVWRDLCRDAWLAPRWIDKFRIWIMPQGWRPEGLPANPAALEVTPQTVIRYDTAVPRGLNVYVFVHFTGTLMLAISLLATAEYRRDHGPSPLGPSLRTLASAGHGRSARRPVARRPMAGASEPRTGAGSGGILALPAGLSPSFRWRAPTCSPKRASLTA
jgi:hypothetical protein